MRKKCKDTELHALACVRFSRESDWIEEQNFTPLHRSILGLSPLSLAAMLRDDPNAVHTTDAQGRTALDWATARAQLSDMRLLIEHNSNVNSMDFMGRTTILHAVDSHNDEAVRILLEAGADPNPQVPEGLFRSSPLKAASFGGLAKMVELLLEFGANIDAYNPEGQTALHAAVISQNVECAGLLLEAGASLADVSGAGLTPLRLAIIHNSHAVLKLLVGRCHDVVTVELNSPQMPAFIAEHADTETMLIILPLSTHGDGFATGCEIPAQRCGSGEKLGSCV